MISLGKEVNLIKSRFWENFIKGSTNTIYHILTLGFMRSPCSVSAQDAICPGNFAAPGQRHLHSGLHPGGKEFFLLRSKNPICENAGWINIL